MSQSIKFGKYQTFDGGRLGLRTFREPEQAARHVVWFPFGGGGAHLFADVAAALPNTWSVRGVDAPGHLYTTGQPLTSIHDMCELYLTHLGGSSLSGAWLIGHSLGALIAARLAHLLEQRGSPAAGCVVCAARPTNDIGANRELSGLTEEELRLRWNSMLPQDYAQADREGLFEIIEPVVRADILAYESCAGLNVRLQRTPLLAVAGADDDLVVARSIAQWTDMAVGAEFRVVEGGHLFVLSDPTTLARTICDFVEAKAVSGEPHAAIQNPVRLGPINATSTCQSAHFRSRRHSLVARSGEAFQLPEVTARALRTGSPHELEAWIESHRDELIATLVECGCILFRGFGVTADTALNGVVSAVGDEPVDYVGGNSPRTRLCGGVYTSTEYPEELEITPHPELCYGSSWPERLYFACAQPADAGGTTPLVDLRTILRKVRREVLERMLTRGLLYVRNLHGGIGLGRSWKSTFETSERAVVESLLSKQGAVFEWREDDALTIRQSGPVLHHHPETGEPLWFNQAEQWHPSALPGFVREALRSEPPPHDVRFADGTPLSAVDVAHIRELLWREAVQFRWEPGDVLVVDNQRLGHGRRAFRGQRRVLVCMARGRRSAERSEQCLHAAAGAS